MKKIQFHPLSEIFPPMTPAEIKELADDISARGLLKPITLFEGKILDGRHRYEGCGIADVEPRFDQYKGKDPVGFVVAANLKRRHLTTAQRAMVAAKMETVSWGGNRKNQDANLHLDRTNTAKTLAVSPRAVATASKILDASKSISKEVDAGKLSLNAAEKKVEQSAPKQQIVRDETGWPVPTDLLPLWNRRGEVMEMLAAVSNISNRLSKLQEDNDALFAPVSYSSAMSKLQYAHMEIKAAQLYAVCPTCQGRARTKCTHCKGRGFLSKTHWDLVPSEIKAIRKKAAR